MRGVSVCVRGLSHGGNTPRDPQQISGSTHSTKASDVLLCLHVVGPTGEVWSVVVEEHNRIPRAVSMPLPDTAAELY